MTLLTVDELREHVSTGLVDDALQRLLDAAEYVITDRAGPAGTRTEIVGGGTRYLTVSRPIDSITSITETLLNSSQLLSANDYRARGYLIERMVIGDHGRFRWWGDATVVYEPVDDEALRIEVEIDLCKSALNYTPGATMEQIGSWTEQFAASAIWNNAVERESILSRLDSDIGMIVVGTPSIWIYQ